VGLALWLDHASVAVRDLAGAVERLERRLGLRATVSPAAPERHSRVYLDRSYLEVSVGETGGGWEASMFFLRFDDPAALRAHLDGAGIEYRFGDYEGVDGTWDDVEAHLGSVPLPTLIRRTAPAAVAGDWPPPLAEPHRCGARALAAVHVEVSSLAGSAEAYGRLLGTGPPRPAEAGEVRVPLASGEVVLREGGVDRIAGIVLSVGDLEATRAALGDAIADTRDGIAWVDPEAASGLPLGFTDGRG